jgi:hypothetical protein
MEKQFVDDLDMWALKQEHCVAPVTDTASNMNKLGIILERRFDSTCHHYCAAHNLQLTANTVCAHGELKKLQAKSQ